MMRRKSNSLGRTSDGMGRKNKFGTKAPIGKKVRRVRVKRSPQEGAELP